MGIFRVFRHVGAHPRLLIAVVVGLATGLGLEPIPMPLSTRVILGFDGGGLLFLVLTWIMMVNASPAQMRRRARLQDESRLIILLLTVGAALFSLAAIGVELRGVKDVPPPTQLLHIGLAAASLVCAWLVTHTLFALHYAHGFYGDGDDDPTTDDQAGGLEFPGGDPSPDYWDFLYFSFVIAMTAQTSDTQITSRSMRRLSLAHGILSFFFNTVILALSINIAAGLL